MPSSDASVPPLLVELAGCRPAPLGWRVLALLLDTFLAGLIATLLLARVVLPLEVPDAQNIFDHQWQVMMDYYNQTQLGQHPAPPPEDPDYANLQAVTNQTLFLVLFIYFAGSELGLRGATLGKRIFNLRAAQFGTADPPRVIETFVRCIIKTISLVGWSGTIIGLLILLLNVIPLLFHRVRRAGHDLLARTIVTGDPLPPALEEPPPPDED